jgi:transposase-like protein
MPLARLVVTAVRIEGRTKAEVSRDYGVSPRWVYEVCRRFGAAGEAGLEPRSRRPRASPYRTPVELEDEIVELRKELLDLGVDAGAQTIRVHLVRRHGEGAVPSTSTVWRRRGAGFRESSEAESARARFCKVDQAPFRSSRFSKGSHMLGTTDRKPNPRIASMLKSAWATCSLALSRCTSALTE